MNKFIVGLVLLSVISLSIAADNYYDPFCLNRPGKYWDGQKCEDCFNDYCYCNSFLGCNSCTNGYVIVTINGA